MGLKGGDDFQGNWILPHLRIKASLFPTGHFCNAVWPDFISRLEKYLGASLVGSSHPAGISAGNSDFPPALQDELLRRHGGGDETVSRLAREAVQWPGARGLAVVLSGGNVKSGHV